MLSAVGMLMLSDAAAAVQKFCYLLTGVLSDIHSLFGSTMLSALLSCCAVSYCCIQAHVWVLAVGVYVLRV